MDDHRDEAERLWGEAASADRRAEDMAERNPTYSEYLRKRADHCRRLARDEEDLADEG